MSFRPRILRNDYVQGVGSGFDDVSVFDPSSGLRLPLTPEYLPYLTAKGLINQTLDNNIWSITVSSASKPIYPDTGIIIIETLPDPRAVSTPEVQAPLPPDQQINPGVTYGELLQQGRDLLAAADAANKQAQASIARQNAITAQQAADRIRQQEQQFQQQLDRINDDWQRETQRRESEARQRDAEGAAQEAARNAMFAQTDAMQAAARAASAQKLISAAQGSQQAPEQSGKGKLVIWVPREGSGQTQSGQSGTGGKFPLPGAGTGTPSAAIATPGTATNKPGEQPGIGTGSSLTDEQKAALVANAAKPGPNWWIVLLLIAAVIILEETVAPEKK